MKRSILFTSALSIVSSSLLADVFSLGQIDVADTATNTDSLSATVLDAQTMQDQERKTLPQALNLLSGVNIQEGGGRNEQMIMMRGFDVKHAPLYIDGIPIAVPYDGYVDYSRFTTFDLSEIDVSKGFASVLLGPNTFAGAINMVTKKPTKEFEGEVGAGVFSGNGKDGYVTFGSNQGKFYVMGSVSGMSQDTFPLSQNYAQQPTNSSNQGKGDRNNAYSVDNKVNIKVGYTPNSTDEYALNYIKQTAEKGVPAFTGAIDANTARLIHYWQWNDWNKESFYFLSKTDFGNWYIKTRAFYDKFDNELDMYTNSSYTTLSSNPTPYHDNTKGVSAELGFNLSRKDSLKFAAHYQLDDHEEGGSNSFGTPPSTKYEMQDQIASFGAEYKKALTDSTTLTLGASYDTEKALKAENTAYNVSGGSFYNNAGATGTPLTSYTTLQNFALGDAQSFNPLLKVETKISDTWSVYGGVDKKSRIPSIKDRYSYKMGQFVPNPDLHQESTINYEIGTAKKFSNAYVKASLFAANVDDYIQSVYVPIWYKKGTTITQQQQLQNVGNMTQRGVELEGTYAVNDKLSFDGSYTHLDMKNSNSAIKITDVPADKFFVTGTYTPLDALSWINSFEYDSSRYSLSGASTTPGNTVNYMSGDVAIVNTKIVYHATKALSLEAGINNLLDRNYYLAYGYPEAGREYYGNVRYKF
ncbi:MAG: TonB-dependent receptor [Thiovulaceae bacterium]|nr:TonB-dependent receptor [Sulfurimonadaceae bacterium]